MRYKAIEISLILMYSKRRIMINEIIIDELNYSNK
jgi:hypothetical protein